MEPAATTDPLATAEPESGGIGRRTRAWMGMGAVVLVLVFLMMLTGPGSVDSEAPQPPADGTVVHSDAASGLAAGGEAPLQFTLPDVNGMDVTLASFKGRVILLNFWATWCGPCRVEILDLVELQDTHRDDLVVLGINVMDEFERVPEFAARLNVNYPMLNGNDRGVEQAYGPIWGLPMSVIIDRDGKISKKHAGIGTKEQFEQYVAPLL